MFLGDLRRDVPALNNICGAGGHGIGFVITWNFKDLPNPETCGGHLVEGLYLSGSGTEPFGNDPEGIPAFDNVFRRFQRRALSGVG